MAKAVRNAMQYLAKVKPQNYKVVSSHKFKWALLHRENIKEDWKVMRWIDLESQESGTDEQEWINID